MEDLVGERTIVRIGLEADVRPRVKDVCFTPESGHQFTQAGMSANSRGCSLTRGLDVKLSMLYLP